MCVEKIMFTLIRSEICGFSVSDDLQNKLTKENYQSYSFFPTHMIWPIL